MRLFRDLADRQIFDQQQSNRLNWIGQAFIIYAMLNTAGRLGAEQWGLSYLEANGYALSRNYTITIFSLESSELAWLLMGLCILALAQVFKYGMQLRQENELTI